MKTKIIGQTPEARVKKKRPKLKSKMSELFKLSILSWMEYSTLMYLFLLILC